MPQSLKMQDVEGWPWLPDKCPPDKYFIDWVRQQNFHPLNILHVGTGLHHRVGIACCAMGHRVIGITVSREEVVSRVFRVDSPNYQVFYANINSFDTALFPELDIITMFHFGEMEAEFGAVNIEVLNELLWVSTHEAYILFYNRSAAWDRASKVVKELIERGVLRHKGTFEELEIYQK